MKKKIVNGFLMVAAFLVTSTSFIACDDTVEDVYADLNEQLNVQDITLRDLLDKQIDDLQEQLDALEARQELDSLENNSDIAALKNRLDALEAKKDPCDPDGDGNCNCDHDHPSNPGTPGTSTDCDCDTTNLSYRIDTLVTRLNEVNKIAAEALALAKRDSARLDLDSIRIDKLEKLMYCWSDSLEKAFTKAHLANLRIDTLSDSVFSEIERLDTLAAQNLRAANSYADLAAGKVAQALKDSIANVDIKLSNLETAYKAADQELRDSLDKLTERVESLDQELDALTGAFNKLITSVLVQGAESPVFGYAALPINLRSNILAAYYGFAGSYGVEFPTDRPSMYVDQDWLMLTAEDIQMLGVTPWTVKDGYTLLGGEGNAGTLYLTVNPNTVDFTGVKFDLVNSIEEQSGIQLSSIAPSDHKLTFGVSRAGNNNGFYEAKATLTFDNIDKVKADIDLNALKDVVKDVTDRKDGVNVTNVVSTLVQQLDGVLDANAVKATWTDDLGETRSTYSHYSVAATAVKPLSYAFGKDFNFQTVPGYERVENAIDKAFNKIKNTFNRFDQFGTIDILDIDTIEVPVLKDNGQFVIEFKLDTTITYTLDTVINVEDVDMSQLASGKVVITVPEKEHKLDVDTDNDGNYETSETVKFPSYDIVVDRSEIFQSGDKLHVGPVTFKKDIQFTISYSRSENIYGMIEEVFGQVVQPVADVNVMIKELKSFIDNVNDLLGELKKIKEISNEIDDVKAQITKYLDKFNNKFCDLINSTNKALQPVLFVKTTDGFAKLSQAKNIPSVLSAGDVTLLPTSYTAEIIAPAVKKLVGVTNVYSLDGTKSAQGGDADCTAALNAVNAQENVGDIVEGDLNKLPVSFQKGYVYEVAYTAVDFDGKVVAQKYYVRVK